MNDMVVKVMGNPMAFEEDFAYMNNGGLGSNGSGPTATGKIQDNIVI